MLSRASAMTSVAPTGLQCTRRPFDLLDLVHVASRVLGDAADVAADDFVPAASPPRQESALMVVRRELDIQAGTENLRNLLEDIVSHADVLCRGRCRMKPPAQTGRLTRLLP